MDFDHIHTHTPIVSCPYHPLHSPIPSHPLLRQLDFLLSPKESVCVAKLVLGLGMLWCVVCLLEITSLENR